MIKEQLNNLYKAIYDLAEREDVREIFKVRSTEGFDSFVCSYGFISINYIDHCSHISRRVFSIGLEYLDDIGEFLEKEKKLNKTTKVKLKNLPLVKMAEYPDGNI